MLMNLEGHVERRERERESVCGGGEKVEEQMVKENLEDERMLPFC